MAVSPINLIILSVTVALSAYLGPIIFPALIHHLAPTTNTYLSALLSNLTGTLLLLAPNRQVGDDGFPVLKSKSESSLSGRGHCNPTLPDNHTYTFQIISHDPLLVYIQDFVTGREAQRIIEIGTPLLRPSPLTGDGARPEARTSSSAPLPDEEEAVGCVMRRAEKVLGGLMRRGGDGMRGVGQMVSYGDGEKFDLHTDWFSRPKITDEDLESGRRRMYNRLATFFVVLEAEGIEEKSGETWFPFIDAPGDTDASSAGSGSEGDDDDDDTRSRDGERLWRKHEDGGVAIKPIPGNAIFWVNLFLGNGTGDRRVVHAGLPVRGQGAKKKAMNIWPRVFFGPDA